MKPHHIRHSERVALQVQTLQQVTSDIYKGRRCRIIADFNGQPYGRSRKSLKGTEHRVAHVDVHEDGMTFFLEGISLGLAPDQIELI